MNVRIASMGNYFIPIFDFPEKVEKTFCEIDFLNARLKEAIRSVNLADLGSLIGYEGARVLVNYNLIKREYLSLDGGRLGEDSERIDSLVNQLTKRIEEFCFLKGQAEGFLDSGILREKGLALNARLAGVKRRERDRL